MKILLSFYDNFAYNEITPLGWYRYTFFGFGAKYKRLYELFQFFRFFGLDY